MDTCRRCGTVMPTGEVGGPYCPNCGNLVRGQAPAPTQAFAAVPAEAPTSGPYGTQSFADSLYGGPAYGESIYGDQTYGVSQTQAYTAAQPAYGQAAHTGQPAQPAQPAQLAQPGQQGPVPAQYAVGEEYDAFFRPPPGQPSPHTMTQVMPPVEPAAFGSEVPRQPAGYGPPQQPAYDQPVDYQPADYQAVGYQAVPAPHPEPYAEGYDPDGRPSDPDRAAKIGFGVAVAAVLVIIISLVTLGNGKSTPSAAPSNPPTVDVTVQAQVPDTALPSADPVTSTSSAAQVPGALQLGATGADVRWLQTRLRQLGLYHGAISGTFDQATLNAVTAFQQRSHPADPAGVVGRSTKTALIAWGSKPRLTVAGQFGNKHSRTNPEDVKRLQRALASALNQNVAVSGTFDAATLAAVGSYQGSVGLPVNGVVDDQVWAALQSGRLGA